MAETNEPVPYPPHDPQTIPREVSAQEATTGRHVVVLLGAGASRAAGVPDLAGLTKLVRDQLAASIGEQAQAWLERGNLEFVLSRLRVLPRVLGPEDSVGGLRAADAVALERAVTGSIVHQIETSIVDHAVFDGFATWVRRQQRPMPLEVFTLNYDLLVETALESHRVPYTDGFVGSLRAPFNAEIVDDAFGGGPEQLPPGFARLWKLHGSINWASVVKGESRLVFRAGSPVSNDEVAAIYPSEEKYSEARRVPFLVLHDRFRRSLNTPETLMLVSGYSFGDDHLSEVIFEAAARTRRSTFVVFCYSAIPDQLASRALMTPSLMVTSPTEAIISGRRATWSQNGVLPGIFEGGRFLLGDFGRLSRFLGSLSGVQESNAE